MNFDQNHDLYGSAIHSLLRLINAKGIADIIYII